MLNGNKSYLISFTALFSKKGYGLAFGVDTVLDVSRDTQYHLSAPAYSTYRTLKMDVMKNATKLPYASSSLFGDGLKEASIVTEIEGVEVESIFASVAAYLSDIQRYLEGESRLEVKGSSEDYTTAETVRVGDSREDTLFVRNLGIDLGGRVLEAIDFLPEHAELVMYGTKTLEHETGETALDATAISDDTWFFNLTVDNYTAHFDNGVSEGLLKLPVFDASVVEQTEAESALYTYSTEERLVEVSPQTTTDIHSIEELTPFAYEHVFEHLVEDFTDVVNRSFDKDAVIEGFVSAESGGGQEAERPESMVAGEAESGDYLYIQNDTEAIASTGGDIHIEKFIDGSSYSTDDLHVEHSIPSEITYRTDGGQPDSFTEGGNEVSVDSSESKTSVADVIKSVVSDSPEIASAGRLLEIMYGHRAAEMIQVGLERLVESHVDETMTANSGSITDAVIAELEKALNEGTAEGEVTGTQTGTVEYFGDAVESKPETGRVEYFGDAVDVVPEHGTSMTFGEGIYDFGAVAERDMGRDAVVHDIGRAIAEANLNLTMQRQETAMTIANSEGILEETHTGHLENHTDVVLTETTEVVSTVVPDSDAPLENEVAAYVQNYDVIVAPTETSRILRDYDAVVQDPEFADVVETAEGAMQDDTRARGGIRVYDAVDDTPDRGSKSNIIIEAVVDNHSVAGTDEITIESVVHGDEQGESTSGSREGLAPEQGEWGDNVTIGDGLLDKEVAQGGADNILDADIQDLGGMSGDNIYDAVNYEGESAYIGDRNLVVDNQEQVQGQLNGGLTGTVVETDTNADLIAITEEGGVDEVTDATRKRKVIPTDIENAGEGRRKKEAIETTIHDAEEGGRVKETLNVSIDEGHEAKRPTKVIETVIEKSEGGTAITHPERKKPRIWLILGKIASWSIWNWKKTR